MGEMIMSDVLLDVKNLVTTFDTEAGVLRAVDGVSFSVKPEQTLGIVGESGCGKSVTSLSVMRLLPKPSGNIAGGAIWFNGQDLSTISPEAMRQVRGKQISMIFQEPMTALNPVHRVGQQLGEIFKLHFPQMDPKKIRDASLEMLEKVGIPDPQQRLLEYPHQLSGGLRQRVMIAIALACRPQLLIADEPTTALDVTIQAQILNLMQSLQKESGMSIIFITHDLGVIAELCDDVVVMYAGKVVEHASVYELFRAPLHPYTHGLLTSIPRLETPPKHTLPAIEGMVPSLLNLPSGCRFQNRCPHAQERCQAESPSLESVAEGHEVSCFRWKEIQNSRPLNN